MQVAQVSFRSLGRTQREAVMAILCAMDDEALSTMHHHGHGEVTLEWHVPASHPILDVLPEPLTIRGRPSQTPATANGSHAKPSPDNISNSRHRRQDNSVATVGRGEPGAAAGGHPQAVVLRDGRHHATSPMVRKASPTAAASRRGASSRKRSLSPLQRSPAARDGASGVGLLGGGTGRGASPSRAPRSVQWAFKLIDEVLCACRKMQVDLSVYTCVEELVQHILTTRFGVTKAHKQLFGELCAAAHTFADLSPLCLLLHSYATKRSAEDLREFILLSKVVGALIPWSSRESVKTVRQRDAGSQHPSATSAGTYPLPPRPHHHHQSLNELLGVETHVTLRRYVSEADLTLALRDAIGAMTGKCNAYLQSGVRRYVLSWMRQSIPSPPIAFDFEGHVDADVLAMMLVEGLREARKEATDREAQYGTFRHVPHGTDDSGCGEDDEDVALHHRVDRGRQVEDLAELIGRNGGGAASASSPLRQRYHVPSPVKVRRATLTPPSSHAAAGGSRMAPNAALQTPPHYRHHHRGKRMAGAVSPLVVSLEPKKHTSGTGEDDGHGPCDSSVLHDDMAGSLMRRERAIEAALRTELARGSGVDPPAWRSQQQGTQRSMQEHDTPSTPPEDDFAPQERRQRQQSGPSAVGNGIRRQEESDEEVAHGYLSGGDAQRASPASSSTTPRPPERTLDRSDNVGSPYAANLDHMRSTLQTIEAELRRRQQSEADDPSGKSTTMPSWRDATHQSERTGRPRPLISPPRPPPSDVVAARQQQTRYADPAASPLSPGGAASDLGDDERLLLQQLEASLMARRNDARRSVPHASNLTRRPLEEIADPFR